MPPAAETPAAVGAVDEALHLLQAYNPGVGFESWTSVRGGERDKLSVNLAGGVTLSADFLLSVFRAFPTRMRGPFLASKTLCFEFSEAADLEAPVLATTRKRRHAETEDSGGELGALVDRLHPIVAQTVRVYNSAGVAVRAGEHGSDERGAWLKFALHAPERLNLAFVPALYTHKELAGVRDLALVCAETPYLFLRPFAADARRIVHEWEVVRQFPAAGSFTFFRKRVLLDGRVRTRTATMAWFKNLKVKRHA